MVGCTNHHGEKNEANDLTSHFLDTKKKISKPKKICVLWIHFFLLCLTKFLALCVGQVLDDKNVRRRFRASNYQSTTRVKPFICTMPMRLDDGWNQIQFNLSDFTRRAYGTNYIETLRVQVRTPGSWCGDPSVWLASGTIVSFSIGIYMPALVLEGWKRGASMEGVCIFQFYCVLLMMWLKVWVLGKCFFFLSAFLHRRG